MPFEINLLKIIEPNKIEDIKYLEGNKNYTIIFYINGEKKSISYNLLKFQKLLSNHHQFIRIHRSYIGNINFIKNIDFNACIIRLITNDVLPIDKKIFPELEKWQKENNNF